VRLLGSISWPTPLSPENIERRLSTSRYFCGKWTFPETKGTEVRQSFVIEGNDWRERVIPISAQTSVLGCHCHLASYIFTQKS